MFGNTAVLTEFAAWWAEQLVSMLPLRLRQWRRHNRDALIIEPVEAAEDSSDLFVRLFRNDRGRDRPIGRFALDTSGATALRIAVHDFGRSRRIVLRVPPTNLLEQSVMLPLAAERSVGQVLIYDMDRLTPFPADAVFWSWAIERRDRPRGRLHVRLTLMPRAQLDPLIRRLAEAGIAPGIVEVRAPDGDMRNLPVVQHNGRLLRRPRRAVQAAAAGCAALTIAVVALPFVLQALAMSRVEQRIADLQPAIAEAGQLRRRIASEAGVADAVADERARAGDILAALAALTDILPDNTFLSELRLAQRHLAMSGQSTQAARLIPALSSDPAIRNPSFAAPVTRTGTNGADVFSIRAELAP